jgi:hypothetical protein
MMAVPDPSSTAPADNDTAAPELWLTEFWGVIEPDGADHYRTIENGSYVAALPSDAVRLVPAVAKQLDPTEAVISAAAFVERETGRYPLTSLTVALIAESLIQQGAFAVPAPAVAVPAETAGSRLSRHGIALHIAERIDKVADGIDREGMDDIELRAIAADVRTYLAASEGTS